MRRRQRMHCKKLITVVAVSLLFVSGCDRTVEHPNHRLNIFPSLGLIQEAKVRVYAADGQTLLAKGTTGQTGQAGLYAGGGKGPAVIELRAEAGTVYYDEALNAFVSLPAGTTMHALVSAPVGSFAVTPLTELAYRIAVDQHLFPLSSAEVNTLNERVRLSFAPELDDITVPPTLVSAPVPSYSLTDTQANRYAVRLMALAQLGAAQSLPAASVMNALNVDILDGTIDALDKNNQAITTPYNGNSADPDYIAPALTDILSSIAQPTLPAEPVVDAAFAATIMAYTPPPSPLVIDLTNIDDGSNFTGCVAGGSTLPTSLQDLTTNLTFEQSDQTSPYANGETLRFTFCANGQLRLANNYYVVANNYVEQVIDAIEIRYSWTMSGNNMVYETVVMNTDLFEVNVYDSNGVYYGRFIP